MDKKHEDNLKYAIQRAIDSGFSPFGDGRIRIADTVIVMLDHMANMGDVRVEQPWRVILFDKEFAKALWGDRDLGEWNGPESSEPFETKFKYKVKNSHDWQYHLQQMVIAEDPIKYLGENING